VTSRSTPAEALELLEAGNARFVAGTQDREPLGPRLAKLADGQSPFAVVLGCSDSRVPIETIFDQAPGNLFVIRVAGNFLNDDNLGSVEYGIEVLKASLIVVLGHSRCGALTAALDYERDGVAQRGHIQGIVDAIAPAVRTTRSLPGEWLDNAIARNIALNVAAMTAESKIVAASVEAGDARVIGGIYDVATGRVAFRAAIT
jgi:carbonic anhydrase